MKKNKTKLNNIGLGVIAVIIVLLLGSVGFLIASHNNANPDGRAGAYRKYGNFKNMPVHLTKADKSAKAINDKTPDIPKSWLKTPVFKYFDSKNGSKQYAFQVALPKINHSYIVTASSKEQLQNIDNQMQSQLYQSIENNKKKGKINLNIPGATVFDCGTGKRTNGVVEGNIGVVSFTDLENGHELIRSNGVITIPDFKIIRGRK